MASSCKAFRPRRGVAPEFVAFFCYTYDAGRGQERRARPQRYIRKKYIRPGGISSPARNRSAPNGGYAFSHLFDRRIGER